jgi:hypothetical protein
MAPLPPLEPPPDALIFFESVPAGPDRSGGYRFAITEDGRFLHAYNAALHDPTRFWTGPLEEITRFSHDAMGEIQAAMRDTANLPEHTKPPIGKESEPTTERLTTVVNGQQHSHTFSPRARPEAAQRLLETVERNHP